VSDIDTVPADSLKALDLDRPIREADMETLRGSLARRGRGDPTGALAFLSARPPCKAGLHRAPHRVVNGHVVVRVRGIIDGLGALGLVGLGPQGRNRGDAPRGRPRGRRSHHCTVGVPPVEGLLAEGVGLGGNNSLSFSRIRARQIVARLRP
jgi:hypothetical protein